MQELGNISNFNRDFSTRNGGDFSCTLPTVELNQKVELVYQQKQKTIVAYISGKPVAWEFNPSKQFSITSLGTFSKLFRNAYGVIVTTGHEKVLYIKEQPSQADLKPSTPQPKAIVSPTTTTTPLRSARPLPQINIIKEQPSQTNLKPSTPQPKAIVSTTTTTTPLRSARPLPEIKSTSSHQINKAIYNNKDERQNLDVFESSEPDLSFINTVKKQAESVACLIFHHFLIKGTNGWQLSPKVPTLAQVVEGEYQAKHGTHETLGEQEAFGDECATGFGTAFLVGKKLALTAAHCICKKDTNILDEKIIQATYIAFGFQNGKKLFADHQVYKIKKVVSHQFTRIQDKNKNFTEWTDWALIELDREAPYTPLKMNMTKKIADKAELYMLGHPYGLPLKFVGNGTVQRNRQNDFFESNLDAFGGNSGSPTLNKATCEVEGMLCSGGEDYTITDNYRGTHKRRIEAHQVTKQEIGRNGFEICQRLNVLRFLLDDQLLGTKEVQQQLNAPQLIIHSIKACYQNRNTIPRLLHSPLPINEVYTELALLNKSKEENKKEEKKKEEKKAFEDHRINSWEDVHASKEPIELEALFKNQQRLLILGRAGSGKSILCQYIAYQWSEGKLWKEKFDALFWVPLRKLQHAHSGETASSFIFRHCCQEKSENLYPHDVAGYLKQNAKRILFVLDGLDEVTLEENSLQKAIVDELLTFPHWILTSRPHAATSIQPDATIENVGFASKTIDVYIQKSFPNNSQAMIQTIRQNPMIFGLCHIPINLELVCSILQKSKGDISFIRSMSGLYEELTLILQKRFLETLGKPSAWHWEPEDIENDAGISLVFKSLEAVAWEGMREKELFFSFNQGTMKKIYCNSYPSSEAEKREPLFKNMCASGFLQSTGDNPLFLHNEYCFLHLTFQEFFAARYLARLLHDNPKEAAKCIQEVKFNPRYKVVMWFTAGLLKNEGGDFRVLNAFFEMLDTPKDLVGLYGTLLKIRCLEECGWQKELQKIKSYEEEIGFWLEKMSINKWHNDQIQKHLIETFEISPQGAKGLFIPKLISCLSSNVWDRIFAPQALAQVGQADPQAVIPALLEALKDEWDNVREAAAEALGQVGQADPQAVIPALLEALKDENSFVKKAAAEALGQVGHADPQAVIPALFEALKDKKGWVRIAAAEALGQVGHADPQAVIPALFEALKDKKGWVRIAAAEALRQVGHADPEAVILPLLEILKDKDHEVKSAAAGALGKVGQTNPKAVIPPLLEALKDKDPEVKSAASRALGEIGQTNPEAVIPHLLEALKDKDPEVKSAAVEALSEIGQTNPKAVIPPLLEALKDKDPGVRRHGVAVLVLDLESYIDYIDPQTVIPQLLEALKDKDNEVVKFNAAFGLHLLGRADLLLEALKDKDNKVRKAAAVVLGSLGHADPTPVIPVLFEALKDKDEVDDVREAAAKALGRVGHANPKAVIPVLFEALKDKDEVDDVREAAAKALGQVGIANPQAVIPALFKALKDEDEGLFVKKTAAEALQKYDLSLYLKPHPESLHLPNRETILTSTPLTSLITCYQKDRSQPSVYSAAIAKKCIEENLSIFQIENTLCYYKQSKLCTIDFPNAGPFTIQVKKRASEYPEFVFTHAKKTENCSIQ
jgi:NLR family CARD domain-containing protein 3